VVFGASKLPQLGDGLGKAIRNFKRSIEPEDVDEAGKPKLETKSEGTTKHD
jgi:sec-independent protein translocase protein TatA